MDISHEVNDDQLQSENRRGLKRSTGLVGTDKSCQERETDRQEMMGWSCECASRAFSLACSCSFVLSYSNLFLFFIHFILLLLLKCLFSSKGQKGVDLDERESTEELEGVGEEKLLEYMRKKKYIVNVQSN